MQASGVKRHQPSVFEKIRARRCVSAALYICAPIDKIKEQKDESGAKRRVRGRGEERKRDALCLLTSYEGGLVVALIGSPRIHLGFLPD